MTIPQREVFKAVRSVLQALVVVWVALWLYGLVYDRREPTEPDRSGWSQRRGFVALSYTALARTDHENVVGRNAFDRHLAALRADGWTSVTTQDVVDFYRHGRPLPDKAVYLMFENGRKDSAIFGQDGLARHDYRGALYMPTGRMNEWNRLILGPRELARLAKNPFWDVQSQGHASDPINLTPDGYYAYFLTDYLRDDRGRPTETPEQFRGRVAGDYDAAVRLVTRYAGTPPSAYIFMPGNTLWNSLDPAVEAVNEEFLRKYFAIAFAGSGPCYNSREANALDLTRMQVQADWDARRLLDEVHRWLPDHRPYDRKTEPGTARWCVDRGRLDAEAGDLSLAVERGRPAFAWLRGSMRCANVDAVFGPVGGEDGGQYCYLRYAARDAYVRIGVAGGVLRVQERIPQRGLVTLYERPWPAGRPEARLHATLKGNRLRLLLDGRELETHPIPVSNLLQSGRLGIGAEGPDGYEARFADLALKPLAERWVTAAPPGSPERLARAADPGVTCFLVPADGRESDGELPRFLTAVSRAGARALALLPDGDLDPEAPMRPLASLPPVLADRLWEGVVFTPRTARTHWAREVETAILAAKERNLSAVVRLDADGARHLAGRLRALAPDEDALRPWRSMDCLLLDGADAIDPEVMAVLRHHAETLLFARLDAPGVYVETP